MTLQTEDKMAETGKLLQQLRLDSHQREDRPRSRRGRWIGVGILLAGTLGAAVVAFSVMRGQRFEVETVTAVAPAASGGATAILQATGYVTARRQATVSAQITGTLTEVLIEEGEHVQAGQVLARLESTAQQAVLAQAQAQFKAAQALLGQYDAQLAQARRDLKRDEDLVVSHLVSQQTLETARTQVETLQAQIESQRKQAELAQAGVQGAQVQLGYTVVHAPFSGVIVAKKAQAGEIVSPESAGGGFTRTGVGTIVDMDSLEIEVDVNEAYINRVQPNQSAQAVLDAYPDWTIPAHVIAIIPTADRSKATVKVRIAIEQKDPRILPDMGVRVSFLEEAMKNADTEGGGGRLRPKGVLVPGSAIVERGGKSVVFTVDADRAYQQAVIPGQTYSDLRLVEGITTGTTVVRVPPADLNDGVRVLVKRK
jgi:RND family efflux transporter MFP subunit